MIYLEVDNYLYNMQNKENKMITYNKEIDEEKLLNAINELEVLYRIHIDWLARNDLDNQEDVYIGMVEGKKEVLTDIKKILDSLVEKSEKLEQYNKPKVVK